MTEDSPSPTSLSDEGIPGPPSSVNVLLNKLTPALILISTIKPEIIDAFFASSKALSIG